MGWFKQLCLSWTILFAAAASVSCQDLRSTLREGNRTCQGEEVIFTCTVRGPSSLAVLVLAWSSAEYIGQGGSLQLSTANMIGAVETSTSMDGSTTATATLTNNTNVNGELVLESMLRITATVASTVTCSGTSGDSARMVRFSISAVPGVPQRINARENSPPVGTTCIILVTWTPPANSDPSDIDQYRVYVPSRNIIDISSSTISTFTIPNCGDDTRVQVAAVNRIGCVGMNSSEVQLTLLDIPAGPTDDGSTTTEGGSAQTSTSVVAAASIAAVLFIILLCLVVVLVLVLILFGKKTQAAGQVPFLKLEEQDETETKLDDLQNRLEDTLVKRNLEVLYNAMKLKLPSINVQVAARDLRTTLLGRESSEFDDKVKEAFITCFEALQLENDEILQRIIENMDNILTGMHMTGIDEKFKQYVRLLRTKIGTGEHKKILDDFIKRVETVQPSTIMSFLLSLCEKLQIVRQVKNYYCKQSKHVFDKLGTEEDRVSVPIWMDEKLDDSWKDSLREAVKAINEAAPGLSLSITEDKKLAFIHVLAIDKEDSEPYTEVEGSILMRLKEKNFVTKIRLGKWMDDGKIGVCIHELLHALGFHHEDQDAITDSKYVYRLDSGKEITIDKNDLCFIRFNSLFTTLYRCEKECEGNLEDHVCKWMLKAYPAKVNTECDGLDMVGLNLVYPPCVDKTVTANNAGYRPKLGKNGMYYCGREVMFGRTYPGEEYTRCCGPDKGPNCPACRTIKSSRVEEILAGRKWQGTTGRVYCGRPFIEPGKLSEIHDGMCGMNDGPACPDCNDILNKEHVQSASHPRTWVQ